jgi:hypothetical protein
MPEVNMGSSIVTAMPVMDNAVSVPLMHATAQWRDTVGSAGCNDSPRVVQHIGCRAA